MDETGKDHNHNASRKMVFVLEMLRNNFSCVVVGYSIYSDMRTSSLFVCIVPNPHVDKSFYCYTAPT